MDVLVERERLLVFETLVADVAIQAGDGLVVTCVLLLVLLEVSLVEEHHGAFWTLEEGASCVRLLVQGEGVSVLANLLADVALKLRVLVQIFMGF